MIGREIDLQLFVPEFIILIVFHESALTHKIESLVFVEAIAKAIHLSHLFDFSWNFIIMDKETV